MRKLHVDDIQTLVEFLASRLTLSKRDAKRLVDSRSVFVNGARVWIGKHRLMLGDTVEVNDDQALSDSLKSKAPSEEAKKIVPLYAEGDALVIDKPAGIECVNGKNHLEDRLRKQWPNSRIVHRLDRDTSGCLLVTSTEAAWEFFIEQFKSHAITKRYLALILGELRNARVVVDVPLDGKSAKTIFHRKSFSRGVTLCEIELLTGRTHQIRRHANEISASLLGDKQYGSHAVSSQFRAVPRQMLHAWKLGFQPAADAKRVEIEAPIPADFKDWQTRLNLLIK